MLLAEAVAAGCEVRELYVAEGVAVPPVPARAEVRVARRDDLDRAASTTAPQPILAVVGVPARSLADLAGATLVVVAAGVADPGNLGTIIRSAEAAGADAVVTTPGSVEAWSPKVVRASAGAVFHLPVVEDVDPADLPRLGVRLLGAVARGGLDHDLADLTRPVGLVVGNEAHGIDAAVPLDGAVTIRHGGRADSLNVAMAATVLLFEAARQRRAATR